MPRPLPLEEIVPPAPVGTFNTPAGVPNNRVALRPLPLRVTPLQYDRLVLARERTDLMVQEHVRRAIDLYLAMIEKEAMELGYMPAAALKAARKAAVRNTPKVVKR